ncbi:hypothetical protein X975_16030, partial [Stegodyphus mimosarum]
MIIHAGKNPHVCEVCNNSFTKNSNLEKVGTFSYCRETL